ncbi:hypothetical protein MMPV_006890 [Pyropia vietnamensis]
MGCNLGGSCRSRGVFVAVLLLLGMACLSCRARGGTPEAVASAVERHAGVLPRIARVSGVRLRKSVPPLTPPAAYYIVVLEVIRPSSGIITVSLDGHIRRLTAEWFASHDVKLVNMFAEHIRSRRVIHAHRTVTYVLALSSNPPVSTLILYSHYCGYQLANRAVSDMAKGVRGQRNMGDTVEITTATAIKAASELQAGGTFDEGGNFKANNHRHSGRGFTSTALIATVCGVLGGLVLAGLGLMLYLRMRGAAAARYSVFHWRGGPDGGSDRPSRLSRSSLASSHTTTGGGSGAGQRWYPYGKPRRSAPSFSASAPAPPERRGASPPPSSARGGGKSGGAGKKGVGSDGTDLDEDFRVSVASSSSFNDSAPGSIATPVTPPPRAATMPPL